MRYWPNIFFHLRPVRGSSITTAKRRTRVYIAGSSPGLAREVANMKAKISNIKK